MRATVASNISVRCASVSSDANTNSLMKYGAQSWFASVNNRHFVFLDKARRRPRSCVGVYARLKLRS